MSGKENTRAPRDGDNRSQLRLGAALAIGIAVGLLVWLVFLRGDDGPESNAGTPPAVDQAGIISPEDLATEARALGRPVYWAGDQGGESLELLRTSEGNVTVRYLTEGVEAGDERPDFLTVGTYPVEEALEVLRGQSRNPGALKRKLPGGGLVTGEGENPVSVYLAYPGEDFQVEIYDPRPGRALQLAIQGAVVPAG